MKSWIYFASIEKKISALIFFLKYFCKNKITILKTHSGLLTSGPAYKELIRDHSHPHPGGSDGKASACNVGDPGSILGSGRSP